MAEGEPARTPLVPSPVWKVDGGQAPTSRHLAEVGGPDPTGALHLALVVFPQHACWPSPGAPRNQLAPSSATGPASRQRSQLTGEAQAGSSHPTCPLDGVLDRGCPLRGVPKEAGLSKEPQLCSSSCLGAPPIATGGLAHPPGPVQGCLAQETSMPPPAGGHPICPPSVPLRVPCPLECFYKGLVHSQEAAW